MHVCGVYLVVFCFNQNIRRVFLNAVRKQRATPTMLPPHVWPADCEFQQLYSNFLFISETEDAFFNKTTENLHLWFFYLVTRVPFILRFHYIQIILVWPQANVS